MTSPRSVREILHAIAMGRRPKAIPPGFGETDPSGTRFFNIHPTGAHSRLVRLGLAYVGTPIGSITP